MALLPLTALVAVVAASCASMGRPEGGPKDELPPVFLTADPLPGALNVRSTKYRLRFDENVQLKDIQKNVIVSPAQKRQPTITGNGRVVTVELRDSLRDSTTYTIDFGDAITDLNEGNILDGFAYAFSTGPVIDTLAISGMVFEARTLEPAQGMIVGAYSAETPDSAITTLPLERVTRTNQYGQFTLRNMAPGSYRVYALNDVNGDYHWDRSEDIAFLGEAITPTTEPITVTDTLKAVDGTDSIATYPGTLFLPNDVILTWFNEQYQPLFLNSYTRPERRRLSLLFNAPADSMPEVRLVFPEGPLARFDGTGPDTWGAIDYSQHGDTVDVWIGDTAVSAVDSLYISARYLKTDTADRNVWVTDTLKMFMSRQQLRAEAEAAEAARKAAEEALKAAEEAAAEAALAEADSTTVKADGGEGKVKDKKKKKPGNARSAGPGGPGGGNSAKASEFKLTIEGGSTQPLNRPLMLRATLPVARFDSLAAKLEVKPDGDSVWTAVRGFHLTKPAGSRLLDYGGSPVEWQSGASYRLSVDSAAMMSIFGDTLQAFSTEFKARNRDEYSSIILSISGTGDRPAVAELLSKDDKPLASAPVVGGKAQFGYLEPDTYYARLFFDDNGNGIYDNGSLLDSIQPEEVVYFPKKMPLKKNWDLEQTWNVYELPLDQQKPSDIKKNKPKKKDGEGDSDEEEEEIQYDEFGRPINNGEYRNPFGGSGNRGSSGGNRGSGGLRGGGFQTNTGAMNQIRR